MAEGSILLVDDDESVLVTMQAILELAGYAVTAVAQGTEALALLRRQAYDLVLTDLRLDDLDGLTVLAEVQKLAPETITIMLTGYASLESAVKALREGAYAYLIKPCDVDELQATIARGMERRRLTRQLRERVQELEAANATIHSLNATLQERVAAATAQLTEKVAELARAKDEIAGLYGKAQAHVEQLQEVDRLKSQFLSMAAHELKTPLTSVLGYLQVGLRRVRRRLGRGYPAAEEWGREAQADLEQLETLERQAKRLARLVDELLDVSRIQTGRIEFQFAPLDLRELVADVVARTATTTAHPISLAGSNGLPAIMGDRDHLEQVVSNLLGNAIKYSPDEQPIAVALDAAGEQVVLTVQDRGVGIPASEREAIFGLFYRSPEQRARQAGGMGLGLYISNEIVKRHGGRIWVESELGRGSAFHVAFPAAGERMD